MIQIVKQSKDFVIVDKPGGMLTVPSRLGKDDPRPCLGILLQKNFGQLFPVHRLDFEVSGAVIFALNPDSHRTLNLCFEKREVKKVYEALTEGLSLVDWMPGHVEIWHSKIQRGKKRSFFASYGQAAETEARWDGLKEVNGSGFLHWTLEPKTGRPHQLRLELSAHGYPILGDELYGSHYQLKENFIALRSVSIEFPASVRELMPDLPERVSVPALVDYLASTK